jgi:hypothetical protein
MHIFSLTCCKPSYLVLKYADHYDTINIYVFLFYGICSFEKTKPGWDDNCFRYIIKRTLLIIPAVLVILFYFIRAHLFPAGFAYDDDAD